MAPKTRKWQTLSKGIYRTTYGIRAVVHIAAGRTEKFFDPEYPLEEIKRWRNEARVRLEMLHPDLKAGTHGHRTFNAAVKQHMETLTISSWKSRRSELRAWAEHWGPMKCWRLKQADAKAVIKLWWDAGVSAKTIINRCRSLSAMWHEVYGQKATPPCDGINLPKADKHRKPFVSVEIICGVEQTLRTLDIPDRAKWRARFMVMAACGQRPVGVKRANRQDVDLARCVWTIPAAKGGDPIEIFLNDDMLAAWRAFIAANAFGDFDATEYARIVRLAGWPAHVKPYATKHTFGRELVEHGVDMQVVADWFGHTDVKTTRESYVAVSNSRIRDASVRLTGRLGWAAKADQNMEDNVDTKSDQDRNIKLVNKLCETLVTSD